MTPYRRNVIVWQALVQYTESMAADDPELPAARQALEVYDKLIRGALPRRPAAGVFHHAPR